MRHAGDRSLEKNFSTKDRLSKFIRDYHLLYVEYVKYPVTFYSIIFRQNENKIVTVILQNKKLIPASFFVTSVGPYLSFRSRVNIFCLKKSSNRAKFWKIGVSNYR